MIYVSFLNKILNILSFWFRKFQAFFFQKRFLTNLPNLFAEPSALWELSQSCSSNSALRKGLPLDDPFPVRSSILCHISSTIDASSHHTFKAGSGNSLHWKVQSILKCQVRSQILYSNLLGAPYHGMWIENSFLIPCMSGNFSQFCEWEPLAFSCAVIKVL